MSASRGSSACIVEACLSLLTAYPFSQGCSPHLFIHTQIHSLFSINIYFSPLKHFWFEYSSFIMCQFLLYSKVNQQHIPPFLDSHKENLHWVEKTICNNLRWPKWEGDPKNGVYVLYVKPNLPICFTSSSHLVIHMSILYVYVSISSLEISSLVLFF